MNPVRASIAWTRSLMAPANPAAADAFSASWRDPAGQAAYRWIVSSPAGRAAGGSRPSRRRPLIVATAAAAAVAVAAGVLTASLNPAAAGHKMTAPMLRYSLTGVSRPAATASLPAARSLLLHLARVAASQPGIPHRPYAGIGYTLTSEWYMSTAVAGGTSHSVVIPQVEQTWSAPGGATRQVLRSGRPLKAAVSSAQALASAPGNAPASIATYPPGQGAVGPSARSLSLEPARLRAQLLRAAPYEHSNWPTSYHLFRIITDLNHQVVPPALDAAIWRVLAGQSDIRDMGTVVDRAGRVGDVVAFTGRQGIERLALIISPSSGRLLGWEDMFLRNPGGLTISTYPAVIGYVSFLAADWTTTMTTPARRQ